MAKKIKEAEIKETQKSEKTKYRILNWQDYNDSLVKRGSLTIWFDESVVSGWYHQTKNGKKGADDYYSDTAISCGLIIREVFHLALRQTQGLVRSLTQLMGLSLDCPHYTTFCRRQKGLKRSLPRRHSSEALHVVVDSTGLKVYGEGEWKVRQRGYSKRRTWRKLHLAVDSQTHEILAMTLTVNDIGDNEVLEELIRSIEEPLEQISGDGAYDTWEAYEVAKNKGARLVAPPQVNAILKDPDFKQWETPRRDDYSRDIELFGRAGWKPQEGYHRRSLAETAMFRVKTIFGSNLKNRLFDHQRTEALLKCVALNKMTQLGMPLSYQMF